MILEVFSCSGGMAEGLRRAGLTVDMAIDQDAEACDSYERNLGHRPIQLDARDLLRMVEGGWSPGDVDLLVADPPCTPWSRAGKRLGQADERDMLAITVALIRELQPRAFLIANVPGLDDGPNWPIVQRTIGGLYPPYIIEFARLDAADYGVPQHRVRPFWYGHGIAWPQIRWPEPTHCARAEVRNHLFDVDGLSDRRPWVTCREALGHLSAEDLGAPVRLRRRGGEGVSTAPRATHLDEPAGVVTANRNNGDGNVLMVNDKHPISRADEPSFTVTTKGDGRGGACVLEWPWDRPATTVSCDDRIGPPEHHEGSFLSATNAIRLSEKAAAILQGFPSGWHFCGKTKRSRWSQIGQAMPPPLAEAVGRSIARALRRKENAA